MDATLGPGLVYRLNGTGTAHYDLVDGVPTLWADLPGIPRAGLLLRMGTVDEPLVMRGVSHLLEHLSLFGLGRPGDHHNGSVDWTTTTFDFQGQPHDLAHALGRVTRQLHAPPFERLDDERHVLGAEAAGRSRSAMQALVAWRYGARTYGAGTQGELGLPALTPETVSAWASWFATTGNAVLWMTCPPPPELRLYLPEGPARPLPPATATLMRHTPAWVEGPDEGVAVSAVVPRRPGLQALTYILRNRLVDELRTRRAVAYSPSAMAEAITADHATLLLVSDLVSGRQSEVVRYVLDLLPALGGQISSQPAVSAAEVAAFATELQQMTGHVGVEADMLAGAAARLLLGLDPRPALDPELMLDGVDAASVAELARAAAATAIALVPRGLAPHREPWEPAATVPLPGQAALGGPGAVAPGRDFSVIEDPEIRVRVTSAGLVIRPDTEKPEYVPVEGTDLLQCWDDGRRVFVTADADRFVIEPNVWSGGRDLVAAVDQLWPASVRVEMGARRLGEVPPAPEIPSPPAPEPTAEPLRRNRAALRGEAQASGDAASGGTSPWRAFWWGLLGVLVVIGLLLMVQPVEIGGMRLLPIVRGFALFAALGLYAQWKGSQEDR